MGTRCWGMDGTIKYRLLGSSGRHNVYVCLLLHERWSVTTDVSLGDHVGVHLREGPKGSCVPGSEGKHMVSINLGVNDTEDKRWK